MNVEELSAIRQGAELQSVKPYIDNDIAGMQKAVISFVLNAVNNGTLTPEIAMSKWVEFVSYTKLQQRLEQRIRVGQTIGANHVQDLDINR